jgi:hypothetical protein
MTMTTSALVFVVTEWGIVVICTLHCCYKRLSSDRDFTTTTDSINGF